MASLFRLGFTLLVVLVFSGCGNESKSFDKGELNSRVEMRWKSKIDREFKTVYQYYSPAYRKFYTSSDYQREVDTSGSVSWVSVKILSSVITGGAAKVKVEVRYTLSLPDASINDEVGEIFTELNEDWVWSSGEWWYVKKDAGL